MAKLVGVYDSCDDLQYGKRQLPINVDDGKIMMMQLSDTCESCNMCTEVRDDIGSSFIHQYNFLEKNTVGLSLTIPSTVLFARLPQTVACVGCRRSVERMFSQLQCTGAPALEPLVVGKAGILCVERSTLFNAKNLSALFNNHSSPLNEILENIPKLKKSGRCLLHSMDGVRCRSGAKSWLDIWDAMDASCRDAVTFINNNQLYITLDNYLRKHRFCQECKNKVQWAYNILIGEITVDATKEKGYVPALYSGVKQCIGKGHIHVSVHTDYIMQLITRAEPELLGRRERHAKTLEIAQEEVLTCLGLFLLERIQRIQSKMREECQTWEILFHVALDALKKSFELAVEKKQGYSKFELLCEELQKQELREKAKKEKRKKKKKNRKSEEGKENTCMLEDSATKCQDCEANVVPASGGAKSMKGFSCITQMGNSQAGNVIIENDLVGPVSHSCNGIVSTCGTGGHYLNGCRRLETGNRSSSEEKERSFTTNSLLGNYNSKKEKECSASMDSLVSGSSQGSRDGGYCSAPGGTSEVVCGEVFFSQMDDYKGLSSLHEKREVNGRTRSSPPPHSEQHPDEARHSHPFTMSLEEMLEDSFCEAEEIPEAEVKAWNERRGIVCQKRAELRQTLLNRFQQFCHKKDLASTGRRHPHSVRSGPN